MKAILNSKGKLIYATCIIYVLMVVAIYQFTQGTNQHHISNFIFNTHESNGPVQKGSMGSSQQSMDLSMRW